MFRTDLLSIIWSLNAVFALTGILTSLAVNLTSTKNTSYYEYSIKTPDDGK
jgi:hypothetical protein